MIDCFLSNISAKYYKNPSMLSLVIAKNVGDVFLRHSVLSRADWSDKSEWYCWTAHCGQINLVR